MDTNLTCVTIGVKGLGDIDQQLAERLMARDEEALLEVIRLYGGVVNGMARRVVKEPVLSEEVSQDVFLALWRRPGAFDPARGSLKTFLVSIARNKAVDLVRKEQSVRRTKDALLGEFTAEPVTRGFESDVETRSEVMDALVQLSEPQRHAIVLAYFGGRTYREVATELSAPEGTVKTRLRDGLLKLRRILTDETQDAGDE
ncbi:MAG: sigma-70 family RNA polymerase sigma factor [Actinomycetota bacterium]